MKGTSMAAAALVGAAGLLTVLWSPLQPRRERVVEAKVQDALSSRSVHVAPAELLALMHDRRMPLAILDLRDEIQWNRFRLLDARRVAGGSSEIARLPVTTVKILVDDDEQLSPRVYRELVMGGVKNVYVLDGGIRGWLQAFGRNAEGRSTLLDGALGDRHPASRPELVAAPPGLQRKVKRQGAAARKAGGCGG